VGCSLNFLGCHLKLDKGYVCSLGLVQEKMVVIIYDISYNFLFVGCSFNFLGCHLKLDKGSVCSLDLILLARFQNLAHFPEIAAC
jgi:hypothetical protein